MSYRRLFHAGAIVLLGAVLACASDSGTGPSSSTASVSGTVVDANGSPAPSVDVTFEHYDGGIDGMHHDAMHDHNWAQSQHMLTDHDGHFHFQYMHDGTHEYRVSVGPGSDEMCYLRGGVEDDVVLHLSNP